MEREQFKDLLFYVFVTMVVVTLFFAMVLVAISTFGFLFYPIVHYITTGSWSYLWMLPFSVATGTLTVFDFKLIVFIVERYLQKEKG